MENAFVKMFVVCFVAEWGDRSQITAVALAAANNVWGVWIGGILVSNSSFRLTFVALLSESAAGCYLSDGSLLESSLSSVELCVSCSQLNT